MVLNCKGGHLSIRAFPSTSRVDSDGPLIPAFSISLSAITGGTMEVAKSLMAMIAGSITHN